jgi:hypothetical protein
MAQHTVKRRLTTILGAEKKKPESMSLVLKRCIVVSAATALIVAVGVGLWQQVLFKKPANAKMPIKEIRCSDLNVVVHSPVHADALIACEGARDAIGFLASQGLVVSIDITIELLDRLPTVVSPSAAGCYLESERRALTLVYSQFRKFNTWFGIPIDRSLYRSIVSHEVAHLVAGYNFRIPKPSIQAKEYIAYITQFSTMEPVLRELVLARFPIEGFEGDWQMKSTIYMLDCMYFGVRAYRHFLKPGNGCDYLHKVLTGKALVE